MKKGLITGVVITVLGALAAAGRVLWDVFSWTGIGYAFGIGDGAGLWAPTLTRVVFWALVTLLVVEVPVLVVRRLDWREGRLTPASPREAWLAAHVSLAKRTGARVAWLVAGWDVYLKQRDRAAELAFQLPARPAAIEDRPVRAADEDAA